MKHLRLLAALAAAIFTCTGCNLKAETDCLQACGKANNEANIEACRDGCRRPNRADFVP